MRIRQSNISTTDTNYAAGIRFKVVDHNNTASDVYGVYNHTLQSSDFDDCNMLVVTTSFDDEFDGQSDVVMTLRIPAHSSFTDKYLISHSIAVGSNSTPHTQDYETLHPTQTLSSDLLRMWSNFVEMWAGPNGEGENIIVLFKIVTPVSSGGRGS